MKKVLVYVGLFVAGVLLAPMVSPMLSPLLSKFKKTESVEDSEKND